MPDDISMLSTPRGLRFGLIVELQSKHLSESRGRIDIRIRLIDGDRIRILAGHRRQLYGCC